MSDKEDEEKYIENMFANLSEDNLSSLKSTLKLLKTTLNNIIPPTIKNFYSFHKDISNTLSVINNSIKNLYPSISAINNILSIIEPINLKPISDLISNISNYANINIFPNRTELTHQNISENILDLSREITYSENLSIRQKRNLFNKFLNGLLKFIKKEWFAILMFLLSPFYANLFNMPHQQIIKESYYEAEYIQEKKQDEKLNLRVIIHNANLNASIKNKKILMKLEVGDIIEVVKYKKDMLLVKEYETGTIGWVKKKYTKSPR